MPQSTHALVAVVSTIVAFLLAIVVLSISHSPSHHPSYDPAHSTIHNLHRVSASVISGAEPVGADAFAELRRMGVRTIVSVDGTLPDVEGAKQFGERYVHIPIGYDGFPAEAIGMLTRVMRECEGPIFVHCHHGKHRGPAAAAVCAIVADELDNEGGVSFLEEAGTSHEYAGLWRDVGEFTPLPDDEPLPELVESAPPEPLVDAMLRIDDYFHRLADEAETTTDGNARAHSNERIAELATLLQEQFHEAARLQLGVDGPDAEMRVSMQSAEESASQLAVAARNDPKLVSARIEAVRKQCNDCHRQHRN